MIARLQETAHLTVLVTRIILPDSPTKAKFLSHDEKIIAVERLRANNMVDLSFSLCIYSDIRFRAPRLRSGSGIRFSTWSLTSRAISGFPCSSFARMCIRFEWLIRHMNRLHSQSSEWWHFCLRTSHHQRLRFQPGTYIIFICTVSVASRC